MLETPAQFVKKSGRAGSARKLAMALAVIVGLLVVAMTVPPPFHGRLASAVGDMGHAPAFVLLGLVGYFVARRFGLSRLEAALGVWLLICAFGLATEVLQHFVGRDDSWGDWLNDVLGSAAGVLLGIGLEAQTRRARLFAVGLGAVFILAGELDAASRAWDCIVQQQQMPLLASFEDSRELDRWATNDAAIERVASHATHGRHALRVDLFPRPYPGVVLVEPPRDWSPYKELVFDIEVEPDAGGENPAAPLELIVKTEDLLHNGQYDDRFHQTLELPPGKHVVRIPLSVIAAAPRTRPMDLKQIHMLQLFAVQPPRQRTFYLDHVRLE